MRCSKGDDKVKLWVIRTFLPSVVRSGVAQLGDRQIWY